MTLRAREVPRDLLDRLLDTPNLARAVQSLEPDVLHELVRRCGLEDCGPIVVLATTEQLMRVFDHDLWRSEKAGGEEEFDADRFAVWLEVLVEAGADVAAGKVAAMDFDFVTAAFHRHVLVLDDQAMALEREAADVLEEAGIEPDQRMDEMGSALETGVSYELGGYRIVARRAEAWDALLAVLTSLAAEHPAFFGRLMARCAVLSTEWIVDNGGLYDVLTSEEQVLADAAADRGARREEDGYVDPPLAVAFLEIARATTREGGAMPSCDHVTAAYFRRLDRRAKVLPEARAVDVAGSTPRGSTARESRHLEAVLREAGVLPAKQTTLLAAATSDVRDRLSRVRAHLRSLEEDEAHARATAELGFLANVLVAGCSFQSRRFRPVEAADAVLAVCNLGLERWPSRWPAPRDLVLVFRVGWSAAHEEVCLRVARALVDVLAEVKTGDAALHRDLVALRRRLETHLSAGAPWRAREELDVLAALDGSTWSTLRGLLDECPVIPRLEPATGKAHRVTGEFDFISEQGQVQWVRDFVASLPERLRG
jgi:hypothetical protein